MPRKPPPFTSPAVASPSIFERNRLEVAGADAARRRQVAIERAHHECQGRPKGKPCTFVAWSHALESQLEIREREDDPNRPLVLCLDCQRWFDKYHARKKAS